MNTLVAFKTHRKNARKRRAEFLLTFEEWLQIWQDSGHLHERGARRGFYVMARYGDVGPYAIGNVKIIKHEDNVSEMKRPWWNNEAHRRTTSRVHKGKVVSEKTRRKMGKAKAGKPSNNQRRGYKLTLSLEERSRRSEHTRQRNLLNNPMRKRGGKNDTVAQACCVFASDA